jgi:hypothetical protein
MKSISAQARTRAEALVALSTGVVTFRELRAYVITDAGRDLRHMRVLDVFRDARDIDEGKVEARLVDYGVRDLKNKRLSHVLTKSLFTCLIEATDKELRDGANPQWPFTTNQLDTTRGRL